MKMRFLVKLSFLIIGLLLSSQSKGQGPVTVETELVSSYVWRGIQFSPSPAIQPALTFSSGNETFFAGAWGSFSLGRYFSEIDLFAGFSAGAFTFSVYDYFVLPDTEEYNYFDFRRTHTGHALEGVIEFTGPENFPVEVTWGTFFYGDDLTEDEKPMFSSYLEVCYPFELGDHSLSVFAGLTPWQSMYAEKAALVNVGLSATRSLQVNQSYSIPLTASLMVNPWDKKTWFVLAVGF
ncbi:MAG: TorF family putative porin [Bacteroidales bacterium]